MHDKVSPILRRYHLVQLVTYRDKLKRELNKESCQPESGKLKYGFRTQPRPKALVGPKIAASQTLARLMEGAYPTYARDAGTESARYKQRFKTLKNRLSAGHDWHALQARFGIGLLALFPTGKGAGYTNSA